jgi:epoxyqueuosine reductase QueG
MDLLGDLRTTAGTDIFGVADASSYEAKAPEGHRPSDYFKDARSMVVLGLRLLDLPLDGLPATRKEYTANFHVANSMLNHALFRVSSLLQERGHKVSLTEGLYDVLSAKTAEAVGFHTVVSSAYAASASYPGET